MFQKYGQQYSRVQMGSERERQINAQLKNLEKIETKAGFDLERLKQNIMSQGRADYKMKQSINYRNNYMKEMEKYKNYDNYELLKKKMDSISNPIRFFDFMSQNELTQDLTYQSDQVLSQEEFNMYLNDLGIETEDVFVTDEMEHEYILNELDVAEYNENKYKKIK